MRLPGPCRIGTDPGVEREGAGQQGAGVDGEAVAPGQDQTAGRAPTKARHTPGGQERRDIDKCLWQRRQGPAETRDRGLDIDRACDPQRRRRAHLTVGISQKYLRHDANVPARPA
jgi:hypothetical protein